MKSGMTVEDALAALERVGYRYDPTREVLRQLAAAERAAGREEAEARCRRRHIDSVPSSEVRQMGEVLALSYTAIRSLSAKRAIQHAFQSGDTNGAQRCLETHADLVAYAAEKGFKDGMVSGRAECSEQQHPALEAAAERRGEERVRRVLNMQSNPYMDWDTCSPALRWALTGEGERPEDKG